MWARSKKIECILPGLVVAGLIVATSGCASGPKDDISYLDWMVEAAPERAELPELSDESTVEDLERYAVLNNPGVQAAYHDWQAARYRPSQEETLPDPMLMLSYDDIMAQTAVGLSQRFPWFGVRKLRAEAATEAARKAEQRLIAAQLEVSAEVRRAYAEHYYLAQSVVVTRENRRLVEQLEAVARARFRAGEGAYREVVRAQVELGQLDDRLRELADLTGASAARLNAAMGRPTDGPVPEPTAVPAPTIEPDAAQLLVWLVESNPELAELEHEVDRRQTLVDLAGKQYYPELTVGADYVVASDMSRGSTPIMASVGVTLPVWRGKYDAAVRESRQAVRSVLQARQDRVNRLGARLRMALYEFRDAERKDELYRETLIPKARESLDTALADYAAGRASFNDVVDATRIYLEFELSHRRALADRVIGHAELEALIGRPLPGEDREDD